MKVRQLLIVCLLLTIPTACGRGRGTDAPRLSVMGLFVLVSDARPIPFSFDCHDTVVLVSGARSLRDTLVITDGQGNALARAQLVDERVEVYGDICAPMASFQADLQRADQYIARGMAVGNALHPATILFDELKAAGYKWTIEV